MECIKASSKQNQINDLELQFNDYLNEYHADKGFKGGLEGTSLCKTFAEAWSLFYEKNSKLVAFTRALVSTSLELVLLSLNSV
jgi:hypothetical protein